MRILFLGAGAVGGYFGGRLAQAGADVTFLVRPTRAERLARDGLNVASPFGDFALTPRTVVPGRIDAHYDCIVLTCKSYDLHDAIDSVTPAVGAGSMVLPLLNGIAHFDALDSAFGAARVVGGIAHIGATMDADGAIRHLNRVHRLTFGERDGTISARCRELDALLAATPAQHVLSDDIVRALWEKYVMLASLAGMTCLMRANVAEYMRTAAGESIALDLLEECRSIATASGYAPRSAEFAAIRAGTVDRESHMTASMLRDIEAGNRIEADHVVGDLVRRATALGVPCPVLRIVHAHLQAYEARRAADRLPAIAR